MIVLMMMMMTMILMMMLRRREARRSGVSSFASGGQGSMNALRLIVARLSSGERSMSDGVSLVIGDEKNACHVDGV